jgi:hypothetical protein
MGVLALEMPAPTSTAGMAGMSMTTMQLGGAGALIGWVVLAVFFLVSAFQAAVLVERLPSGYPIGRPLSSLTLERLALLTGSLAMVAMAASMLAGAGAPITA